MSLNGKLVPDGDVGVVVAILVNVTIVLVVLAVVLVLVVVVWCLSDMWCVLQLGQEGTLGICDLLARKQAEERRYFGDKRFNRFKEAITSFRVFSRVSPAETWALYLLGA